MNLVLDLYNRQLHPEEKKWINKNEAAYAKKYGLTLEQARNELSTQANLQVQNGSPKQWNRRAAEFLGQAHGLLPADGESGPGYMFFATLAQPENPNMYAANYANGEGLNQPAPGDLANSVDRQNAYRDLYEKGTWGAAAGAATIALAGPIAMIPGAPILSTNGVLGASTLTSPMGTGAISATMGWTTLPSDGDP
jgi:filamentous hemagglutinin